MLMPLVCATGAQSSTAKCARYARDLAGTSVHGRHMDVAWFKALKKEKGVTDAALADVLGVERSVANKVTNGHVAINPRKITAIAKLLGVTADEMMFRAGFTAEPPIAEELSADEATKATHQDLDMVEIQMIDLAYGLGATYADSAVEIDVVQFPKVWVQQITHASPAHLTWTRGRGDSMSPTIEDGDLILLDRSQTRVEEQDAMWAFAIGDINAIKRLRVKGDRYQIFSDNPNVLPDEEPQDFVRIVARVVFVGRRK